MWGLGIGAWDLGFGVCDLGSGAGGLRSGVGDRVWDLRSGVWGSDLGSGIWGLGLESGFLVRGLRYGVRLWRRHCYHIGALRYANPSIYNVADDVCALTLS